MNGERAEHFGHRYIGKHCGKCAAAHACDPPYCTRNPQYWEERAKAKRELRRIAQEADA